MAETPCLITVVIPAHNAEAYLEQSVACVCGQQGADWELLIVENGSTDGTAMLAERLAAQDSRIRVLHSEKGVSHARNLGIEQAKGDYLTFLDADDRLLPQALSFFSRMVEQYPDTDVIVATTDRRAGNNSPEVYTGSAMEQVLVRFLRRPTRYLTAWGKLYRTALLQESEARFDPSLSHGEDSDYVIRLLGDCRHLVLTEHPVYHYFLNPHSTVRSGRADLAERYSQALEKTRHRLPFGEATRRSYPFYVLDNLLVLFTNDTFHPYRPAAQQRRRAKEVLAMPVFRDALREADVGETTFIKRVVFAMARNGHLCLLQAAVWLRRAQNRYRQRGESRR